MKREALLPWAAGILEGCGAFLIQPEQGPSRKYLSITINFPAGSEDQVTRLLAVNNNGSLTEAGFEVSGYVAVRGFLHEIWPHLTSSGRAQANEAIRFFKEKRKLIDSSIQRPTDTPSA
jgi:hypothetical protein